MVVVVVEVVAVVAGVVDVVRMVVVDVVGGRIVVLDVPVTGRFMSAWISAAVRTRA